MLAIVHSAVHDFVSCVILCSLLCRMLCVRAWVGWCVALNRVFENPFFELKNCMCVPKPPSHPPTHPRGWVRGWVDCILILVTATMRLRHSLSNETYYVKPEAIKLCIYGDGRIVGGWVVWEPKTQFFELKNRFS